MQFHRLSDWLLFLDFLIDNDSETICLNFILIDMRSFDCLIGWQAHEGEVCSIQFSADETTVYSMGTDGKVNNIKYE